MKLKPSPERLLEIAAAVRVRQVEQSTKCIGELKGFLAQLRATDAAFSDHARSLPIPEMMVQIGRRDETRSNLYRLLSMHADRLAFGDCPALR